MKLRFSIHYRTEWGQQLQVALRYTAADGTSRTDRMPMNTQDGDYWQAEVSVVESRRSPIASFSYYYQVCDADGKELRREWTLIPRTYSFDTTKTYTMTDQWRDLPLPYHLYSKAYAVTIGLETDESVQPLRLPLYRKTILFRVSAPQLLHGQRLAVIGSHPSIGAWNPVRYLPMDYAGQREWILTLNADMLVGPLEYKYVVVDEKTSLLERWEEGDNRVVNDIPADGEVRVEYGDTLRLAEKTWRAAGVCIPVFSLRSTHSFGVGDFGDLYRFVDWACITGMKVIQLLPVNDTTLTRQWGDSHPYNIVSAFALHPHYIDLEQLGPLPDKKKMTSFLRRKNELNALAYTDYEAVERVKGEYLADAFSLQGAETLASDDFKAWFEDNKEWLVDYASWMVSRTGGSDDPAFYYYVQYQLHRQLKRAAAYAHSKGVILKGDLPIGVSSDSVETATHPEIFRLDCQTGTPPEQSSQKGQNWGFPTYEWSELTMKWFQRRLKHLEQYFDAIRMDHVVGFFRVWEIPCEQVDAVMGHFSPSLPLSVSEIEYFGLSFRREFLTRPFINDRIINRLFGIHAQYVRDTFLNKSSYGLYELKPEVSTQLRVERWFKDKTDENSLWIRDGLKQLAANVLLLEDQHQPDMYHPRIYAYREPVFEALPSEERDAYMRLYSHYFFHRHSMFWGHTGYQRLSEMLGNTPMLVCAEDLGALPDCVPSVLDSLRILTLEIQRLPKLSGQEFAHLDGAPLRSVVTISTHDMSPLRQWWAEQPEQAQRFYITMLQKQGSAPDQLLAHLAEEIIARHLYSPSMLCVLAWQDWMAMDSELRSKNPRKERINMPSDPYNRWQWRMHLTIEQLLEESRFNEKLKTMITRSKR